MGFPWYFHGIPAGFLLDFHEVSMESLWHFYGIPVVFLWDFLGFPKGFPWYFFWISMMCFFLVDFHGMSTGLFPKI